MFNQGSGFTWRLGRALLWLTGWQVEGELPQEPRLVIIAAPHTSNWDFLYLIAAAWSLRLPINWLGKDSLFMPVMGAMLRGLGGIPVDRSQRNQLVSNLADTIRRSDQIAIVIPPEGTRGHTDYWKSGFYQIARAADVPMLCSFVDYERRTAGLGPLIRATGDVEADMAMIRSFYADKVARYPARFGEVRLKPFE